MNLTRLTNQELWEQTQKLVLEERRLATQILWHLEEVSRRRLYLERGFPSLFAYCIDRLGYTPGAASRRIKAMQLLRTLPEQTKKEVETRLNEGKISLSNVSSLQFFFEKEKKHCERDFSQEEKISLLNQIQGKTQEECQKLLCTVSLDPEKTILPSERKRVIAKNKTEIKFIADDALLEKLNRIRELIAHKNPNPTYCELFDLMAEVVLKKIDPAAKSNHSAAESAHASKSRQAISQAIKTQVYKRDAGCCTYEDPMTHRKCGAKYGLEYDHVIPVALGGDNKLAG